MLPLQARRWQQAGRKPLRVSVNVSSLQFQSANFVAMVERVLADTGVPPALVEIELTRDRAVAIAITELAHALGITVVAERVETAPQAPDARGAGTRRARAP